MNLHQMPMVRLVANNANKTAKYAELLSMSVKNVKVTSLMMELVNVLKNPIPALLLNI